MTQGMSLEVMSREGAQKVIMNIVRNFHIYDRRKIECMHRGVVELPPARSNYPRTLKADGVTGTAKLPHGTMGNTTLSLSFNVFHDVSNHTSVYLSIHLSIFLNTRYQHRVTVGAATI